MTTSVGEDQSSTDELHLSPQCMSIATTSMWCESATSDVRPWRTTGWDFGARDNGDSARSSAVRRLEFHGRAEARLVSVAPGRRREGIEADAHQSSSTEDSSVLRRAAEGVAFLRKEGLGVRDINSISPDSNDGCED